MKHDVIERYLNMMPEESVDSMIELAREQRWAFLLALITKKRMYFNEIKQEFGADPAQVDAILKHLVAGGFVARRVMDLNEMGDRRKTYYTPTPLAHAVVKAITDAFLPPEPAQMVPKSASYTTANWRIFPQTYSGIGIPTASETDIAPRNKTDECHRMHHNDEVNVNA